MDAARADQSAAGIGGGNRRIVLRPSSPRGRGAHCQWKSTRVLRRGGRPGRNPDDGLRANRRVSSPARHRRGISRAAGGAGLRRARQSAGRVPRILLQHTIERRDGGDRETGT